MLDQHGVDTTGLTILESSVSEDASELEQDLSEVLNKFIKKLSTAQKVPSGSSSTSNAKLVAAEENIAKLQADLSEVRAQKAALEKRIETFKVSARESREEIATLTAEIDDLKVRVEDLQYELQDARGKVVQSSESVSTEMQALEEENIELLKENKELRKQVSTFKLQNEKLQQISKSTPLGVSSGNVARSKVATVDVVEKAIEKEVVKDKENDTRRKRSFGSDSIKPIAPMSSESIAESVDALAANTRRTRSKAKPIASGNDVNGEAPGECAQS